MQKAKAGVLAYVLAIVMMVSVGLSLLITYIYYSRQEYIDHQIHAKMYKNLTSAIQITLGAFDHFEYDVLYRYDLYGTGEDSVSILRKGWGFFDLYKVQSYQHERIVERIYTVGHQLSDKGKSSLFLVDDGRPLSVVGNTRLTGNCYLPVAGIQSAYINRIGYRNKELLYGKKLKSDKKLPDVSMEEVYQRMKEVQGWQQPQEGDGDTISNLFADSLIEIRYSGHQILDGVYQGQVFLRADRITFDSLARTEDVVVLAKVIEFNSGFKGSGQFLATDTIIIHSEVKLSYPTVLACYNEDEPATIVSMANAEISGWMLLDGDDNSFRQRVIYLEDGTGFQGMIYCNGMFEMYGELAGHATVKRTLVNSNTGVYENYLMNASMNYTELDSSFLALPQWFYNPEGSILKYLR